MDTYSSLPGGNFRESFLMEQEYLDWPNNLVLRIWSPADKVCYRITLETILEYHFMRTGTGKLQGAGIPLDDIYLTKEEEYSYWSERIGAYREQGFDDGKEPICLEFSSPLFANRKREILSRNKNVGLFVACRYYSVEEDYSYDGPTPESYSIPSDK